MDYPGLELENFDKAVIWRKYIYLLLKKYIKKNVLEVGAGIGSFTRNYEREINKITILLFYLWVYTHKSNMIKVCTL